MYPNNDKFMKISMAAGLVAVLLMPTVLRAEPLPTNACTQKVLSHMHLHQNHTDLTADADTLFVQSLNDAYKLSMPLMAVGLLGDQGLYNVVEARMKTEMKKRPQSENDTYADWLYGRILLADYAMNGKIIRTDVLITLQRHIDLGKKRDNFTAWAVGYLAAVDYAYKDKMLNMVNEFTADKTASKSDKLWAWVLVMQAAAKNQDMGTYLRSMDQINAIAGKSTVADSLRDGLVRTADNSDYPAWAIGIARLSAATIGDTSYFESLEAAMNESLDAAKRDASKDYKARAEKLLAETNNRLAIERNEALLACRGGKPVNFENCAH